MLRLIVVTTMLWCGAALAQPREASINAFFGRWVGSGLSESALSQTFRLTQRDIDIEVQPDGDGFRLTSVTVQRQKGDPVNPNIARREGTLVFRPTGERNVWRAATNEDPLTGKPFSWARIEKQTLVITTLDVEPGGRWEMQIWRRTLSDLGMKLDYSRLTDGEPVRSTQGRLTKYR